MKKKNRKTKPEVVKRKLTVKEYAAEKGVHVSTAYRRVKAGVVYGEQPAEGYRVEILL